MSNLLGSFNSLIGLIANVRPDVVGTPAQPTVEKEKHDPGMIASLRAKAKAAQELSDSISSNILVALVPSMAEEMRDWSGSMKFADTDIDNRYYERQMHAQTDKEKRDLYTEEEASGKDSIENYMARVPAMFSKADSLRKAMLLKIPPQTQTQEDKDQAVNFSSLANKPINADLGKNFNAEASYLENLGKRVAAIHWHNNDTKELTMESEKVGLDISTDRDVKAVLEFMQKNITASKLVGIAEALPGIARLRWSHNPQEPVQSLTLVSAGLTGD
jgi:hypothetical protein